MDSYTHPAVPLIGDWAEERDHVQKMFDYNVRSYMETMHAEGKSNALEMAYLRSAVLYCVRGERFGLKLRLPNEMVIRATLEGLYGDRY